MGQSLGGWTTVMASVIEPRINASVSLAGVTNVTKLEVEFTGLLKNIGVSPEDDFFTVPALQLSHSAVEYINGTHGNYTPNNLLLIHGRNDVVVNVSHSTDLYNMVNDPSTCELYIVDGAGSDHILLNNTVVGETIAWFETKLLGAVQSPIESSQFTYIQFYIMYFILLLQIWSSVFGIGFILFKLKDKYVTPPTKPDTPSEPSEEKTYGSAFINLIIWAFPALGIWIGLLFLQGLVFNYLIVLLVGGAAFILLEFLIYYHRTKASFSFKRIKEDVKSHLDLWGVLIAIACAAYFLGMYYIIAFSYKFLMLGPQSLLLFVLSILAIFPFMLGYEFYQRKLIQDKFPERSERGKWVNRFILAIITPISFYPLYYITLGSYLAVLVIIVFMIAVSSINVYFYGRTQNVLVTSLFGSIVVAFFVAHCYFFFI
jgi:hypothetical protein